MKTKSMPLMLCAQAFIAMGCGPETSAIGTLPPSQRQSPLTPGTRAELEAQGAECTPNPSGPVFCSWSSEVATCALVFRDDDALESMRCTMDDLEYRCDAIDAPGPPSISAVPSDEDPGDGNLGGNVDPEAEPAVPGQSQEDSPLYYCRWSDDDADCGDGFGQGGTFLGHSCDWPGPIPEPQDMEGPDVSTPVVQGTCDSSGDPETGFIEVCTTCEIGPDGSETCMTCTREEDPSGMVTETCSSGDTWAVGGACVTMVHPDGTLVEECTTCEPGDDPNEPHACVTCTITDDSMGQVTEVCD